CLFQAFWYVQYIMQEGSGTSLDWGLPEFNSFYHWIVMVVSMTAGTVFLMWLGEQIDEYGIGNGISLIIMAGIVARIPAATASLFFENGKLKPSVLTLGGGNAQDISFEKLVVLAILFVAVVVAVIAITKGQRRIPTQSAKH